jgi:predicted ArsR family transcriptional regulator
MEMTDNFGIEAQISAVAALKDPVRRDLYQYVVSQRHEISRDQAAQVLGITRAAAAFHLDRLVSEGLLEATYRRESERRGPGAGRPAKFYRRSSRQIHITLPPRNYELAARLLGGLLGSSSDERQSVNRARKLGVSLARSALDRAGRGRSRALRFQILQALLQANGFEPKRRKRALQLVNCPFESLVQDCPDLICKANLGLMEGILRGLELRDLNAVLDCQPDECCVSVIPRAS